MNISCTNSAILHKDKIERAKVNCVNGLTAFLDDGGDELIRFEYPYISPEYWPRGLLLNISSFLIIPTKKNIDGTDKKVKRVIYSIYKVIIDDAGMILFNSFFSDYQKIKLLMEFIQDVTNFEKVTCSVFPCEEGLGFVIDGKSSLIRYDLINLEMKLYEDVNLKEFKKIEIPEVNTKPFDVFLIKQYLKRRII